MTSSKTKIYGFTLLRNAIKYDYPYKESFESLAGIAEKIYLALGASEDGTEAEVAKIPYIVSIPTVWDESLRKGGTILSQQTNIALKKLRETEIDGWAFHLQADELISDLEYEQILNDFAQAEKDGCDAVSFRYLHFWQNYDQVAYAKRWYPQEIRAIRVKCEAESYGDAQSFKPVQKIFYSNAHILHYGHVREKSAYEKKKKEFHHWWHSDEEMKKVISKGEKNDDLEPSLRYLGPHPKAIQNRMAKHGALASPTVPDCIYIHGERKNYNENFLSRINAKQIQFFENLCDAKKHPPEQVILTEDPGFFFHLGTGFRFKSKVPTGMFSPQARAWEKEFHLLMLLSEKNIAVI